MQAISIYKGAISVVIIKYAGYQLEYELRLLHFLTTRTKESGLLSTWLHYIAEIEVNSPLIDMVTPREEMITTFLHHLWKGAKKNNVCKAVRTLLPSGTVYDISGSATSPELVTWSKDDDVEIEEVSLLLTASKHSGIKKKMENIEMESIAFEPIFAPSTGVRICLTADILKQHIIDDLTTLFK